MNYTEPGETMTQPDQPEAEGQTAIEDFTGETPAGAEDVQSPDAVALAVAAPAGEDPGPVPN